MAFRGYGREEKLALAAKTRLLHEEEDDVDDDQKDVLRHILHGASQAGEHRAVIDLPDPGLKRRIGVHVEALRRAVYKVLQFLLVEGHVFYDRGNVRDHDGNDRPDHACDDAQSDYVANEGRQRIAFDVYALYQLLKGVDKVPQADRYDQRQKDRFPDLQNIDHNADGKEA